jgi:hypothetical protein
MYQYLYSKLIKCYCSSSYRGQLHKKVPVYICLNYSTGKGCSRRAVKEEEINTFFRRYCDNHNLRFELSRNYIRELIKEIIVDETGGFTIHYKNNDIQWFKDSGIKYV